MNQKPMDNMQGQEPWGRERSKTLKLRVTWSDIGTQAQKTQIHSSNKMAVELPQCTTAHAHGHSVKDKV